MSTYDSRLAALEKDVTVMRQDIIYKLDETNTALTMFQGVVAAQGRDIKDIKIRLDRSEIQLEGLTQEVRTIREQQNVQGRDIKDIKIRLDRSEIQLEGLTQEVRTIREQQNVQGRDIKDIKIRLDGMDQRFDGIDQHFISLEAKFDQRFDQVLQALANLTNKP